MFRTFIISISLLNFFSCSPQTKENQFWQWFQSQKEKYYSYENNESKLFDNLSAQLHEIDPNLTFEFSPININGTRELTISADGILASFPAVEKLVANAPKMDNWKVNAFRQRIPGDEIRLKFNNFEISYQDIYFRHENDNGKIGIELNIQNYDESNQIKNAVYVLLDGLIGEYDMETKIGWIEMKKLDQAKAKSFTELVELRNIVDKL